MENKEILDPELIEVDLDDVFLDNYGAKRSRSSILKQTKYANIDVVEQDEIDTKLMRKSQNAKRVSFADTFQVKQLNTGNIYDIPGRKVLEYSKENTLSIQLSPSEDKENLEQNVSRLVIMEPLKDLNVESGKIQEECQRETNKGFEDMSLSESVVSPSDLESCPLNSTCFVKPSKNIKSYVEVLSTCDMDMTLMCREKDSNKIKLIEREEFKEDDNQPQMCELVTAVSCITHSVRHTTLKSITSEENCNCALASKLSASIIEMPIKSNQICYESHLKNDRLNQLQSENVRSCKLSVPNPKHIQQNSFRVVSDDRDFKFNPSLGYKNLQSSLVSTNIMNPRSSVKSPERIASNEPLLPVDIFNPAFLKPSGQPISRDNFKSELIDNFDVNKYRNLESRIMLSESFEINKENYPLAYLEAKQMCPRTPDTIYSIRKIKRLKLSNENLKKLYPRTPDSVYSLDLTFKPSTQLKTTVSESRSINNNTNDTMLPTTSKHFTSEKEQQDSSIFYTSNTTSLPCSTILKNLSPDKDFSYPIVEKKPRIALESSGQINFSPSVEKEESPSEEPVLSLDDMKRSIIEASSGKQCRWKLKTLEENEAVFRLEWGPWIFKCALLLLIKKENGNQSSVSFKREDIEDCSNEHLERGYRIFQHLAVENTIPYPVCSKEILLKLSEYSSIAYKVEIFMRDMLYLKGDYSCTFSDELDPLRININIINERRKSRCVLTCCVNLQTYSDEKIVTEIQHKLLNDVTDEVAKAVALVEPQRNYVFKIAKAAHSV